MINLAILKLFVDDRNSFTIKKRENLDLNLNFDASHNLDENSDDEPQFILQHNEKVNINSLIMNTGNNPEKNTDKEQILMTKYSNEHANLSRHVSSEASKKSRTSSSSNSRIWTKRNIEYQSK